MSNHRALKSNESLNDRNRNIANCVIAFICDKGLAINYGEGEGATKWENRGSNISPPPPLRWGKTFCAPFSMAKSFSAPPLYVGVKLHHLPSPFCSPPPLPVISDQSLTRVKMTQIPHGHFQYLIYWPYRGAYYLIPGQIL